MSSSGDVLAGNTLLNDLLIGEIRKVIPYYGGQIKDFETFILGKLYKLYALREKRGFKNIYKDFSDIYPHITAEQSLIDMEHVVSDICRLVLEAIYNLYFEGIPKWRLREIHNEAKEELKHNSRFVVRLLCDLGIDTSKITWSQNFVFNAVGRLPYTKGNSTVEKLINIIILNYYCGRRKTKELLSNNAGRLAELTESINVIRRKVSHAKNDSHKPFSKRDYTFFMDNVIDLINRLIEPFGEEL